LHKGDELFRIDAAIFIRIRYDERRFASVLVDEVVVVLQVAKGKRSIVLAFSLTATTTTAAAVRPKQ